MCSAIGARKILKRKFELIAQHLISFLMVIYGVTVLTHTNLKPNPTYLDRQFALIIYQMAAGCTCSILSFFDVSVSAASTFFNKICWLMVVFDHDRYVRLHTTNKE